MVVAAVTFGVLAVVIAAVLIGAEVIKGDRPEEAVAAAFLGPLFEGRGADVHELTTPDYQALVFASDLERLSEALRETAGDVAFEILGSERSPGTEPLESYVGYSGTSSIGTVEGVLVLIEIEEGEWRVQDVSYRFPDAPREETAALFELTQQLNDQIVERARSGSGG